VRYFSIYLSGKLKTSTALKSGSVEVCYADNQGRRKQVGQEQLEPSLQNCKTAGFFSLNRQLAANACKSTGISGSCFQIYDSWREKLHIYSNCVAEAVWSG
jgi:hypothetical protein